MRIIKTFLHTQKSGNRRTMIQVECACGRIFNRRPLETTRNRCRFCAMTIHGHGKPNQHTRTYDTWMNMRQRCNNPKNTNYYKYGARGITVCDRWMKSFVDFLADMGERPKDHTLDRIDNNLGYFPENCKWATVKEQSRNTRRNKWYEFNGKRYLRTDLASILKLSLSGINRHLKEGRTIEQIFQYRQHKIANKRGTGPIRWDWDKNEIGSAKSRRFKNRAPY